MKKTYLNPETSIVLIAMQPMLAGSPEGFTNNIDDTEVIDDPNKMLSRRKSVWDEGMEEEEEQW